jgi:putative thiamine transport system ATP-binding protein
VSLKLDGVRIAIGAVTLVPELDIAVAPGERVTVMGPSGCGKSTLLAFIAGTIEPVFTAAGCVAIDGVEITHLAPERRGVGILFQDDLLFPHLSVGANLAFGLKAAVRTRDAAIPLRKPSPKPISPVLRTAIRRHCPAASARVWR